MESHVFFYNLLFPFNMTFEDSPMFVYVALDRLLLLLVQYSILGIHQNVLVCSPLVDTWAIYIILLLLWMELL